MKCTKKSLDLRRKKTHSHETSRKNRKVSDKFVEQDVDGKIHNMASVAQLIKVLLLRVFLILCVYKNCYCSLYLISANYL